MKNFNLFLILFVLFSVIILPQAVNDSEAIIKDFFKAFNDHDAEKMSSFLADDVEWFSIESSMMMMEASGKEDVKNAMNEYFKTTESVFSELEDYFISGSFVSVREAVSWESETGLRTQASIGVYEIKDGKIRRVWYFPAEKVK